MRDEHDQGPDEHPAVETVTVATAQARQPSAADASTNPNERNAPNAPNAPNSPNSPNALRSPRRRAVLLGAGGVALGIAGLATAAGVRVVRGGVSAAPPGTIPDHRVAVPSTTPKLVVARGPSPVSNLSAALGRIGGMRALISPKDIVLIKPNIGWDRTPAQAANTDPDLVAAIARACVDCGAKEVIVTDVACNDAERSFLRSGIADAARKAGARVLLPSEVETRAVAIPGKPGVWTMLEPYVRATKVINVPVAKHHGLATLTAGMKNWFGLVKNDRLVLHAGLAASIVGLASLMRPTLTIVDATRVLVRNGPSGGNLGDVKKLGALALSLDPVAVDAWAATELGFDPASIEYIQLAAQWGLGTANFASLSPVELHA